MLLCLLEVDPFLNHRLEFLVASLTKSLFVFKQPHPAHTISLTPEFKLLFNEFLKTITKGDAYGHDEYSL